MDRHKRPFGSAHRPNSHLSPRPSSSSVRRRSPSRSVGMTVPLHDQVAPAWGIHVGERAGELRATVLAAIDADGSGSRARSRDVKQLLDVAAGSAGRPQHGPRHDRCRPHRPAHHASLLYQVCRSRRRAERRRRRGRCPGPFRRGHPHDHRYRRDQTNRQVGVRRSEVRQDPNPGRRRQEHRERHRRRNRRPQATATGRRRLAGC